MTHGKHMNINAELAALEVTITAGNNLAGHPDGSQAFGILYKHVEEYRDQALLSRGLESYKGKELKGHDIIRSRKETVKGLRELGLGTAEAKEAVRTVERKVMASLNAVLGKGQAY